MHITVNCSDREILLWVDVVKENKDIEDATSVDFCHAENVTSIGDDFLGGCENLKEVDLSPIRHIPDLDERVPWLSRKDKD